MDVLTKKDIEDVTRAVINKYVIPDFNERNHNASGEWIRSLDVRVEPSRGVITGLDYTEFLMRGRGPNEDQSDEAVANWARWYGQNVFEPWVRNKGLSLNPYAIAYTIARQGTKIYRQGGSDFLDILNTKEVQDFIVKEIGNKITVRVVDILRREIKEKIW